MKSLIAGDWHGSISAAKGCIEQASEEGCTRVIQVGDFGIPFYTGSDFLDRVSDLGVEHDVEVFFLDGNHENFDTVEKWVNTYKRDPNGLIPILPNLTYMPRGAVWKDEDGLVYAVMGGAASIDRDWRTIGFDYFPQELITPGDVFRFFNKASDFEKIDVLLTHDCSDRTDWGFALIPDSKSQMNRRVIDEILDYLKPDFHFHGHMHKRYEWVLNGITKVYGLNLENERHSRGVLEVDANGATFEYYPYKVRPTIDMVQRIGYTLG